MSSSLLGRVLDRELARLDPDLRLELATHQEHVQDRLAAAEREDLALSLHADVCSILLRREEA